MINITELENTINNLELSIIDTAQRLKAVYTAIENAMEKEPWYKYLINDKFTVDELLKYYYALNDDDDTIWIENTPDDIMAEGEKAIEEIRCLIYEQD